jgi:hypothetical protein
MRLFRFVRFRHLSPLSLRFRHRKRNSTGKNSRQGETGLSEGGRTEIREALGVSVLLTVNGSPRSKIELETRIMSVLPRFHEGCMCGTREHRMLVLLNVANADKPCVVRIPYGIASAASTVCCNAPAPDHFCCSHPWIETGSVSGFRVLP